MLQLVGEEPARPRSNIDSACDGVAEFVTRRAWRVGGVVIDDAKVAEEVNFIWNLTRAGRDSE